jgi:hypothetical protein
MTAVAERDRKVVAAVNTVRAPIRAPRCLAIGRL